MAYTRKMYDVYKVSDDLIYGDVFDPNTGMIKESIIPGGAGGSVFVGYVQSGGSFPTTRGDGSPLVVGDYVKPKGPFPFTIGTITFNNEKDSAVWAGVEWLYNASMFQKTNETPVNNRSAESLSGNALYQANINVENKAAILGRVEQLATLPAATVSDLGRIVQFIGATTTTLTNGYFYKVEEESGAYVWKECRVSKGGGQINGVEIVGNKTTEDIKIVWQGTRAEYNAITAKNPYTAYIITDEGPEPPSLKIKYVYNSTTYKLKTQLWSDDESTMIAETDELDFPIEEMFISASYVNAIPSGETGEGEHGIKFVKKDGTFAYVQLKDSVDKVITAEDTATLKNKSIDADLNTLSNIKVAEMKSSAVSTTIAASATASDSKLTTEKAVRTELDTKQDTLVAGDNISIDAATDTISSNQIDDTLSASLVKTWSVSKIIEEIRIAGATFRGAFDTKADLDAYSGTKEKNDRAVVTADETKGDATTMYSYSGTAWQFEYKISDKPLELDDTTVGWNASGKLHVKDDAITNAKLNSALKSTAIPSTGAVDSKIATEKAVADVTKIDDTTIERDSTVGLRIKNDSVTPVKMKSQTAADAGKGLLVKTDGTVGYENIRQYLRVSTLTSGIVGNTYTWYYLDSADGAYEPGSYVWVSDVIGFKKVETATGSSSMFVGTVVNGGSFPTTRPDGTSALVMGDYVKPDPSSTFPITVEGKTFTSSRDSAVYLGAFAGWQINATPYQNTGDTPIVSKTSESINGVSSTAVYQSAVNAENAGAIKSLLKTGTFSKVAGVAGKVNLTLKNWLNTDVINTDIENVVFAEDTQTLKNKSIDADDNTITDLMLSCFKVVAANADKVVYFDNTGTVGVTNEINGGTF